MSDQKRRINGLQRPWHEFQIATWVLFPIILVHYYAFLMHLLWRPVAVVIVLTIAFSLFAIACAISAYITLAIDPVDDALLCVDVEANSLESRSTAGTVHCYLCEKDVDHSSKHCRFCDKCIVRFDHHCKWLNTCIGQKNYPYFLAIIVSVLLLTSESLGISIALLVEAFAYPRSILGRIEHSDFLQERIGSALSLDALQGLLIASVVVLFGLVAMIVQLGSFHVMLLWRGITTYDFIVLEQKRLREKQNQKLQRQIDRQNRAKSKTAISAEEGKSNSQSRSASSSGSTGIEMRGATASAPPNHSAGNNTGQTAAAVNAAQFKGNHTTSTTAAAAGREQEKESSSRSSSRRYAQLPADADTVDPADTDVIPYGQQQQLGEEEDV